MLKPFFCATVRISTIHLLKGEVVMRNMCALALSFLISLSAQATPGLLLFLIDKNNVRLEKYSLDEISDLTHISNKISSMHCKQILKIGDKQAVLEEIGWHDAHPDMLMINFKGSDKQPMSLHLKELFSDKTIIATMKFVPGALYLLDDPEKKETSCKTHMVLQLSDVDPLMVDRELFFERAIIGGCVFLVDDVDAVSMARAKKTLTRQELDAYAIVSLPAHEIPAEVEIAHAQQALAEQPSIVSFPEEAVENQADTVVAADESSVEESKPTPVAQAEHVAASAVAPVKPVAISWYRYMQVKLAAAIKYINNLFFK